MEEKPTFTIGEVVAIRWLLDTSSFKSRADLRMVDAIFSKLKLDLLKPQYENPELHTLHDAYDPLHFGLTKDDLIWLKDQINLRLGAGLPGGLARFFSTLLDKLEKG